jgi:hypothetical protein
MKKYWFIKCLKFAVFAVAAAVVFTWVLMSLWNWLIPELFNGKTISFLQALGILVLSKILFSGFGRRCGGCGHHGRHGFWKERMRAKLEKLSPEEREKYKEKIAKCWGSSDDEFCSTPK